MTEKIPNDIDNNIEMEKFVLSSMLLKNGENVEQVASLLTADDFYRPEHRVVFNAILALAAKGITPNILSLTEELRANGKINDVGIEFTLSLAQIAFTTAYTEIYCQSIKEKANLRRLIAYGKKISEDAQKGKKSSDEIISEIAAFADGATNTTADKHTSFNDLLDNHFIDYIYSEKQAASRKTGFENIDDQQNLQPGLYLIGGKPAVGKTTFVWQLAEQMARNGETAIYCSYEMSKGLILKKSIARELYNSDPSTLLTTSSISRNFDIENHQMAIIAAMDSIRQLKLDLHILELHDENIDALIRKLKPMCDTSKPPTIVVDYVQIIPSGKEIKQALDENVRKLKVFQRDTKSTIFVVSSFNRANYAASTSFESFKESGILEYTADVVWGLQLWIANKVSPVRVNETREAVSRALKQVPRKIQLRCLKNRFGGNYDCCFRYYAGNDTFVPADNDEFEEEFEEEKEYYGLADEEKQP